MKNTSSILRYAAFAICLMISLAGNAQSIRDIKGKTNEKNQQSSSNDSIIIIKHTYVDESENIDTIYCTKTKKQHGWFAPLDTISKEYTTHRNTSFRFTNKNKNGKWLKMETIDGYGNLTTSGMAPYIVKKNNSNDSIANKDWVELLQDMCIFEFIPDPSGLNVMQERAYDKNHNLIYTFVKTPISENTYIGSYKDYNGLPAEMRPEPGFSYGTLVKITADRWGNDSIIEFIDSKGVTKINSDGAYSEMYEHDKYGRLLKQASRDKNGNFIRDSWGNCGIQYEWNGSTESSATYTDENWNPMRMPFHESNQNVIKTVYEYDEYQRIIRETFVDENNNPDVNIYNCHYITNEYDRHGNMTKSSGYDLNDNPTEYNEGVFLSLIKYDTLGRLIELRWLDKYGNPCSIDGCFSKISYEYDSIGNEVFRTNYDVVNGVEQVCYQKDIRNPYVHVYHWIDGTSRIDSLDAKGRVIITKQLDSNNELYNYDGIALTLTEYIDEPGKCTKIKSFFDKDGNMAVDDNFATRRTYIIDSTNNIQKKFSYDINGRLIQSFAHEFDKNGDVIAEYDANRFGNFCRAGGTSGVCHFKANVQYSIKSGFASLIGRDEFDEPDYICTTAPLVYYYQKMANTQNLFLDENSRIITDVDSLKNERPKVMSVEVVDSIAYAKGFRDNDIIIVDGDYSVDLLAADSVTTTYYDFRANWSLHSVFDADKTRDIVVFRVIPDYSNPKNSKYGLVLIPNITSTPSENGYSVHIRYLTDRQLNRIQGCLDSELSKSDGIINKDSFKKSNHDGDNYVILGYWEPYRTSKNKSYPSQVADPSIVLGTCIQKKNLRWTIKDYDNADNFNTVLSSRNHNIDINPVWDFFLTKDGQNLIHMQTTDDRTYADWFDKYISDEDYAKIKNLYDTEANDRIHSIMEKAFVVKEKLLYGNWITSMDIDDGSMDMIVSMDKNKTATMSLCFHVNAEISDGITLISQITVTDEGSWSLNNNELSFDMSQDSKSINIDSIDLLGVSDEQKSQFIKIIIDNKEELLNELLGFDQILSSESLQIDELSKTTMVTISSDGKTTYTKKN